jgi:choline transport protein
MIFATVSIMTTSSRMTYAFARDRGVPFSWFFAKVHPTLDVPLNALVLTTILVIIFGCIFLGSSSAFTAITSASVVCLGISYAIPPAINCLRGRKMLPPDRPFVLPGPTGWICNLVSSRYLRKLRANVIGWNCLGTSHHSVVRLSSNPARHRK